MFAAQMGLTRRSTITSTAKPARHLARHVRSADRAQRDLGHGCRQCDAHQSSPLGGKRKRRAFAQAIGTSRGGRTTKLHGLTDGDGRPRVLLLSPGNITDMTMAPALIDAAGTFTRLLADKGYDAHHIRTLVGARGAEAVIPATTARCAPIPYDREAYRARNQVERLWCRLKDWRRVATRYDKLAANYLSLAILAATITYWCN